MEGTSAEDVRRIPLRQDVQEIELSSTPELTLVEAAGLRQQSSQTLTASFVSPIAGRLRLFANEWQEITSDQTILSWICGYKIPFEMKPVQLTEPEDRNWSFKERSEISKIVNDTKKRRNSQMRVS